MTCRRWAGSSAVERLVEQQQLGVVGQRLGQLDALAHALREAADRALGGVLEADDRERPAARAAAGSGTPRRRAQQLDQLARREERPQPVAVGHDADPPVDRRARGAGRSPSTRTVPGVGSAKPAHSFRAVDLPAPLWPSSPVTPGAQRERDLGQRDGVAVPLRDALEDEHRPSRPRSR